MNTHAHIISQKQKECLVNFLEQHDYLAETHRKTSDKEKCNQTWRELMLLLNSIAGPKKTIYQWKETLNELKAKARKRVRTINVQSRGPEHKQTEDDLTPLEHRLLLVTSDRYVQSLVKY